MSFEEILIIVGLALVVIGPQRLPEYAEQLGRMVRNLRQMATGATQSIREELGDDIADLDLSKFDPRQYDPRRIVREALLEDIVPATKPARGATPTRTKPVSANAPKKVGASTRATKPAAEAAATTAGAAAAATAAAVGASATTGGADPAMPVAGAGPDLPPFDDEAT